MAQLISESPPSYDSMFGQLKEAKSSSDGNVSFARKGCDIICGSLACTILLVLFLAIPVTCIVIGAIYKDDCPAERYIPIYLIVAGCFSVVKDLSSLIQNCLNRNKREEEEGGNKPTNVFDGLVGCFLFAWFICGMVKVIPQTRQVKVIPQTRRMLVIPQTRRMMVIPQTRQVKVIPQTRRMMVIPQTRQMMVIPQTRQMMVIAETRQMMVIAETRQMMVIAETHPIKATYGYTGRMAIFQLTRTVEITVTRHCITLPFGY